MADLFESARIDELASLIKKYQDSYYNGEAEIEDAEFDKLWDELKALDPNNPILKKVGADSGNFEKAAHVMPMGSQEKAADPEQFWLGRQSMFTQNTWWNTSWTAPRLSCSTKRAALSAL